MSDYDDIFDGDGYDDIFKDASPKQEVPARSSPLLTTKWKRTEAPKAEPQKDPAGPGWTTIHPINTEPGGIVDDIRAINKPMQFKEEPTASQRGEWFDRGQVDSSKPLPWQERPGNTIFKAENPALNAVMGIPRVIAGAGAQQAQAVAGAARMAEDATGLDLGSAGLRNQTMYTQEQYTKASDFPDFEQGAASFVAATPGMAFGGMGAVSAMTALTALPKYQEGRIAGMNPTEAALLAGGHGLVEYWTEKLPMGILFSKNGLPVMNKLMLAAAPEYAGEQGATLFQDAIDFAALQPDKTFQQFLAERPSAAWQTLVATTGGMVAAGAGMGAYKRIVPKTNQFADVLASMVDNTTLPPVGYDNVADLYRRAPKYMADAQLKPTEQLIEEFGAALKSKTEETAKAIAALDSDTPAGRKGTVDAMAGYYKTMIDLVEQYGGAIPPEVMQNQLGQAIDLKSGETPKPAETPAVQETAPDANPANHQVGDLAVQEFPIQNLVLSTDVPQFKNSADDAGVVTPLGGKFDRRGVGAIQVWGRNDGTMEVISGRHRLDLAKRSGEETIPVQIHREAEGFTQDMAAMLDAELNIRDEQGTVADYAQHFKNTGIDEETARERGLLARAKGRTGFEIARDAGAELLAAHRAGQLSDEAANSIAKAAPNDERMQAVGQQAIAVGRPITEAVNTMRAVAMMQQEREAAGAQADIFGFDDSAMKEAIDLAKGAAKQQRAIREQIAAVQGAAKRPDQARKLGVDIKDPASVNRKIAELKQQANAWENWTTHPDLVAQLRSGDFSLAGQTPEDIRAAEQEAKRKEEAGRQEQQKAEAQDVPFVMSGSNRPADEAEARGQGAMFSKPADNTLIAQHNLTAENLLHAVRMGGIPVPSLAITEADNPLNNFGEITLLASKDMADPKGYAEAKVFGSDIYSPRYPSVTFDLDSKALKKINAALAPFRKDGGREVYGGEISKIEDLTQTDAFRAYMLDKTGKTDVWDLRSGDMEAEASQMLAASGAKEKLFRGYDYNGNRRYQPHTLENVVKILKKELRGGEGFNYGLGSVRAKYTPQFRTIEQIRKAKGRLHTKSDFTKVKEEMDQGLMDIGEMLGKFHGNSEGFGYLDAVTLALSDAAKMGIPKALRENGFDGVPIDAMREVGVFLDKLRGMPTEYFEAKILRDVSLSEFAGAVVPEGTRKDALDALEKAGVTRIATYKKGDEESRKSAIKRLAKEITDSGTQALFTRPKWYSPLKNAIDSAPDKGIATGLQARNWILANKAKMGLKDDEIEFSGILNYLELRGKDKVTKAEIADYLAGNGVVVNTVEKGGENARDKMTAEDAGGGDYAVYLDGQYLHTIAADNEQDAIAQTTLTDADKGSVGDSTKFSGYWESSYKGGIPGSYRETLVTLPVPSQKLPSGMYVKVVESDVMRYHVMRDDGTFIFKADSQEKAINGAARNAGETRQLFNSPHWDEPNVLVHLRTDEVSGADGKRYLRVGEIQSDWGQKGKKDGFGTPKLPDKPGAYSDIVVGDRISGWGTVREIRNTGGGVEFDVGGLWIGLDKFDLNLVMSRNENNFLGEAVNNKGVPSAPFVTDTKDWVALGIKQAIRQAIDAGVDGIVFGTGQQNADLYDLSKQVDYIDYVREKDDLYRVAIVGKNGEGIDLPQETFTAAELENYVGKDVAQRIVNGEGEWGGGRKTLRGPDLKVGGEGMKAFYDRIVPQVANDVLRKLGGGKVGPVVVSTPLSDSDRESDELLAALGTPVAGEVPTSTTQPGFEITDAMRAKAETEGLPLFNKAQKKRGMQAEEVAALLRKKYGKKIDKMLGNGTLHVVQSEADVDVPEARMASGFGGVWDGKTAWIVADSMTPDIAGGTFLHEVGEHAGMRNMLGDKYSDLVARFEQMLDAGEPLAIEAASRVPEDTAEGDRNAERLAYLIEIAEERRSRGETLTGKVAQFVRDLIAAIRAFVFRKIGGINLTTEDIVALAKQSAGLFAKEGGQSEGAKFSGLQSEHEVQPDAPRNTPLNDYDLLMLRRAAAEIDSPEKGITFRVDAEGRAIVTGPARVRVPDRFQQFANRHGLTLVVRRGPTVGITTIKGEAEQGGPYMQHKRDYGATMPIANRQAGALYFGEIGNQPGDGPAYLDRTGMARFSKLPSSQAEELAKKYAFAVKGLADSRVQQVAEKIYLENDEMFNRLKRGVVSNADSKAAGEAIAAEVGWSPDSIDQFIRDAGMGGTPPVQILAATMAMARTQSVRMLEAQSNDQFMQYTVDTLRTLMATRVYGSEMGRALQFIGAMEREGGWKASEVQPTQPTKAQIEAQNTEATETAEAAKEVLDTGMFNELTRKTVDVTMSEAEYEEQARQMESDLADATKRLESARKARDDARKKMEEARRALKAAKVKEGMANDAARKYADATIPDADVRKAEADMKAAQDAREAARKKMVHARRLLAKAIAMRNKADQGAATNAAAAATSTTRTKAAINQALDLNSLKDALGGDAGISRIREAMRRQGADLDLGLLVQYLSGLVDSIAQEATKDPGALNKLMAAHVELWRANILTGLFTHEVNVTSNVANFILEFGLINPIKEMLPGGVGLSGYRKALAGMGGYRKVLADIWALMKYNAFEESQSRRISTLLDQRDPETIALMRGSSGSKWSDSHRKAIPGMAGKIVRGFGFVPLGVEDAAFKVIPFRYELARQEAAGEAKNVTAAIDYASKMTFQEQTGVLGLLVAKMHEKMPYSEFWVTFVKTMTNLVKRSADLTPGLSQIKNAKNLSGKNGEAAQREAMALSIVGAGIASIVLSLAGDDDDEVQLSGYAPADYRKKILWLEEHDQIGLRVGEDVYPLYRFSPLSEPAGMVIGMRDSVQEKDASPFINAMYQAVMSKHFMAKVADLYDGMQEVARAEGSDKSDVAEKVARRQLSGIVSGTLIPNALSQVGDMSDKSKRESKTFLQDLQKKVPSLRETLPEKLRIQGDVMEEPRYMSPFPIQPRQVKKDEITRWLLGMNRGLDPNPKSIRDMPQDERQKMLKQRWVVLGYAYDATKSLDKEMQADAATKVLSQWGENASRWNKYQQFKAEQEKQ